ncbi:hypothetical protein KQI68_06960 [Peptoniphilus sp. MSJ-1]|uniref:SH3b domain-containing protein n=1 Tax=Peptoniphilus ovalis TaxID=2841503 RepID=A0ABS6FHC9_9FIRM|nr:SH3 domain-containing protein [Peptoniphilus ovalis]MBU5669579.1 hypothetical protein [Peptoniphilus ovalis]
MDRIRKVVFSVIVSLILTLLIFLIVSSFNKEESNSSIQSYTQTSNNNEINLNENSENEYEISRNVKNSNNSYNYMNQDLEDNYVYDGKPMEYVPSDEELEEMEKLDEYNSSQVSPYKKGQKLTVISDKAYNRAEPSTSASIVGYWIKGDEITVYDYIFYEDKWWIKTSEDKEWWTSTDDLEV